MRNNNRNIIIVFIVTLVLICGIFVAIIIINLLNSGLQSGKVNVPEYQQLFNNEAKKKMQLLATVQTKTRHPVSNFTYDEKYYIEVFKIDLKSQAGLNTIVHEKNLPAERITGILSPEFQNALYEMSYQAGGVDKVRRVDFTFAGDSAKTVLKNDSVACYYLKMGSFSIGYNGQEGSDIWAEGSTSVKIPVSIAFFKKQKNLYLIFLTVNENSRQTMDSGLLYQLIKN